MRGAGQANHPSLEWFKVLNIAGLTYDLLGILVLSEIAIQSERITNFFVNWIAGLLLWGQTVAPLAAALGAWLIGSGPSSAMTASFFFSFFVYSLLPLGLLDSLVFDNKARTLWTPVQRSRTFGLLLLVSGLLAQLVAAFRDLYA